MKKKKTKKVPTPKEQNSLGTSSTASTSKERAQTTHNSKLVISPFVSPILKSQTFTIFLKSAGEVIPLAEFSLGALNPKLPSEQHPVPVKEPQDNIKVAILGVLQAMRQGTTRFTGVCNKSCHLQERNQILGELEYEIKKI